MSNSAGFRQLHVAIVGGGIGGLSAAVALRRAGHRVDVFERRGLDVEVGASISCAANGSVHLEEWGIDIKSMNPVALVRSLLCPSAACILMHLKEKLIMRDWETGAIQGVYDLSNYEQDWGRVYYMLHRQDMHKVLLKTATASEGPGTPCKVFTDSV